MRAADENTPLSIGLVDRHFPGAGSRAALLAWGPAIRSNEPNFVPSDQLRIKYLSALGGVSELKLVALARREQLAALAAGRTWRG